MLEENTKDLKINFEKKLNEQIKLGQEQLQELEDKYLKEIQDIKDSESIRFKERNTKIQQLSQEISAIKESHNEQIMRVQEELRDWREKYKEENKKLKKEEEDHKKNNAHNAVKIAKLDSVIEQLQKKNQSKDREFEQITQRHNADLQKTREKLDTEVKLHNQKKSDYEDLVIIRKGLDEKIKLLEEKIEKLKLHEKTIVQEIKQQNQLDFNETFLKKDTIISQLQEEQLKFVKTMKQAMKELVKQFQIQLQNKDLQYEEMIQKFSEEKLKKKDADLIDSQIRLIQQLSEKIAQMKEDFIQKQKYNDMFRGNNNNNQQNQQQLSQDFKGQNSNNIQTLNQKQQQQVLKHITKKQKLCPFKSKTSYKRMVEKKLQDQNNSQGDMENNGNFEEEVGQMMMNQIMQKQPYDQDIIHSHKQYYKGLSDTTQLNQNSNNKTMFQTYQQENQVKRKNKKEIQFTAEGTTILPQITQQYQGIISPQINQDNQNKNENDSQSKNFMNRSDGIQENKGVGRKNQNLSKSPLQKKQKLVTGSTKFQSSVQNKKELLDDNNNNFQPQIQLKNLLQSQNSPIIKPVNNQNNYKNLSILKQREQLNQMQVQNQNFDYFSQPIIQNNNKIMENMFLERNLHNNQQQEVQEAFYYKQERDKSYQKDLNQLQIQSKNLNNNQQRNQSSFIINKQKNNNNTNNQFYNLQQIQQQQLQSSTQNLNQSQTMHDAVQVIQLEKTDSTANKNQQLQIIHSNVNKNRRHIRSFTSNNPQLQNINKNDNNLNKSQNYMDSENNNNSTYTNLPQKQNQNNILSMAGGGDYSNQNMEKLSNFDIQYQQNNKF